MAFRNLWSSAEWIAPKDEYSRAIFFWNAPYRQNFQAGAVPATYNTFSERDPYLHAHDSVDWIGIGFNTSAPSAKKATFCFFLRGSFFCPEPPWEDDLSYQYAINKRTDRYRIYAITMPEGLDVATPQRQEYQFASDFRPNTKFAVGSTRVGETYEYPFGVQLSFAMTFVTSSKWQQGGKSTGCIYLGMTGLEGASRLDTGWVIKDLDYFCIGGPDIWPTEAPKTDSYGNIILADQIITTS